jgi:hypothetical protein
MYLGLQRLKNSASTPGYFVTSGWDFVEGWIQGL